MALQDCSVDNTLIKLVPDSAMSQYTTVFGAV